MLYIVGLLFAVIGGVLLKINIFFGVLLVCLGGILAIVSLIIPKAVYKERNLVNEYELVHIVPNVYVIKLCDGKIVCKYLDKSQNNKEITDIIDSYWKEINEIADGEKATLNYYERKLKWTWRTLPFFGSRFEVTINIPKDSIIS